MDGKDAEGGRRVRLMIISHACALPQNQQLFALAARDRGWKVSMVIPQRWKNEYGNYSTAEIYDGFDADLVPVNVLNNGNIPLHAYLARTSSIIRRHEPDVIYAHHEAYGLATMQWCRAAKINGDIPFGFFSCQNLVKRYPVPFRQGESWVYRNSRFFFPITDAVDKVHREKGYAGKSTVLPLGFDPEIYFAEKDVRQRHMAAAGRPFRFAFVGRVVEEKGLTTLAQAMGMILDLDWNLTMVGSGDYESEVKQAFDQHGIANRVEWRGFVPHAEVARFFESVDCLLLPSETRPNWKEQFGRVIVESMACGTPVVGSNSGEIPTIIRTTGGGLVFQEADPISCAEALRKIVVDSDERADMAEAGHDYVHQYYALPRLSQRFADTIESVANRSTN